MINKIVITLFATLVLTACTKTIMVPESCPSPIVTPEPHYPVANLRPGDSPDKVAKAYVATVQGQHDYIESLKQILEEYQ